jgi:hypothetical protein
MNKKAVGLLPYREFRHKLETELVYTRKDLADAVNEAEKANLVTRVIRQGEDVDVAMRILAIHRTPEGLMVIVK